MDAEQRGNSQNMGAADTTDPVQGLDRRIPFSSTRMYQGLSLEALGQYWKDIEAEPLADPPTLHFEETGLYAGLTDAQKEAYWGFLDEGQAQVPFHQTDDFKLLSGPLQGNYFLAQFRHKPGDGFWEKNFWTENPYRQKLITADTLVGTFGMVVAHGGDENWRPLSPERQLYGLYQREDGMRTDVRRMLGDEELVFSDKYPEGQGFLPYLVQLPVRAAQALRDGQKTLTLVTGVPVPSHNPKAEKGASSHGEELLADFRRLAEVTGIKIRFDFQKMEKGAAFGAVDIIVDLREFDYSSLLKEPDPKLAGLGEPQPPEIVPIYDPPSKLLRTSDDFFNSYMEWLGTLGLGDNNI